MFMYFVLINTNLLDMDKLLHIVYYCVIFALPFLPTKFSSLRHRRYGKFPILPHQVGHSLVICSLIECNAFLEQPPSELLSILIFSDDSKSHSFTPVATAAVYSCLNSSDISSESIHVERKSEQIAYLQDISYFCAYIYDGCSQLAGISLHLKYFGTEGAQKLHHFHELHARISLHWNCWSFPYNIIAIDEILMKFVLILKVHYFSNIGKCAS